MSKNHVVISGTGRSGTTFLVQLLTHLGLETGFNSDEVEFKNYDEKARAGLELDIRQEGAPYIVKSPWFCDYAKEVLERDDIVIEHVFIPIRDLHAAAESRRLVVRESIAKSPLLKRFKNRFRPSGFAGGLWHTNSRKTGKQEEALQGQLYKLVLALSDAMIPVTFMRYPRIVKDCRYLFEKLKPVLGHTEYEDFTKIFNRTVRPQLVHSFNVEDC